MAQLDFSEQDPHMSNLLISCSLTEPKLDILLHLVYAANSYAELQYLINTQDQ